MQPSSFDDLVEQVAAVIRGRVPMLFSADVDVLAAKIVHDVALDRALDVVAAAVNWEWWETVASEFRRVRPMSADNSEYYAPMCFQWRQATFMAVRKYRKTAFERAGEREAA